MSRTRTKSYGVQTLSYGYYEDPGLTKQIGIGLNSFQFGMGYRTITDSNNRRRRPPSGCQHVDIEYHTVPRVIQVWANQAYYEGKGAFSSATEIRALLDRTYIPFNKEVVVKMKAKIDSATKIADEFSLLNNVFELPDLGDLFSKYSKMGDIMRSVRDGRGTATIPNYLDWKFGLEPVTRDLRTLVNNIANVRNRISAMSQPGMKALSGSENKPLNKILKHAFGEGRHLSLSGGMSGKLTGQVSAIIPGLHEAEFQLKALLDVIGLHIDPLMAYDAVPFSWLLDWFIPIGDTLRQMNNRQWVKVDLSGQAFISTKTKGHFQIYGDRILNPWGWGTYSVDPGSGAFKMYDRIAFRFGWGTRPVKDLSLSIPDFDAQKSAILASLAAPQRVRAKLDPKKIYRR